MQSAVGVVRVACGVVALSFESFDVYLLGDRVFSWGGNYFPPSGVRTGTGRSPYCLYTTTSYYDAWLNTPLDLLRHPPSVRRPTHTYYDSSTVEQFHLQWTDLPKMSMRVRIPSPERTPGSFSIAFLGQSGGASVRTGPPSRAPGGDRRSRKRVWSRSLTAPPRRSTFWMFCLEFLFVLFARP